MSVKVPKGGNFSIFSLFLSLFFCLKIVGLRLEGLVRFRKKLSGNIHKYVLYACVSLK